MELNRFFIILLVAGLACAADPAYQLLDAAYQALRARDYDRAVTGFLQVLQHAPDKVSVHKDLAYTLLKIGETERARDQFAEALRLQPDDEHLALEYAFLCHETQKQAAARRVFDRVRRSGNATAQRAFDSIDHELAEGISRWSRAVELSPDNHSAHRELARLAEHRDDLAVAAEHYHRAWVLRPELRSLLLDLGRVWKAQGKAEDATAALLAASRGAEARTAEAARELLPTRYPYVYEFQASLKLDPVNTALRRELAYLHLAMGTAREAEAEFARVVEAEPGDALSLAQLAFLMLARNEQTAAVPLLTRALDLAEDDELADRIRTALGMPRTLRKRPEVPRSQMSAEARTLAERSLEAGYLKDALKYLRIAHENDPIDFAVMLKLGWTYNLLHDDRQALEWFRLARSSPEPAQALEARRAFGNLSPTFARLRTSAWVFPMYSSRWKDLFTYAQFKTEIMPSWPVHVYLSTRFAGDTRKTLISQTGTFEPQYLSESAGIFALGASTKNWRGLRAWAESGLSVSYLGRTDGNGLRPDHRGGLTAVRSFGHNIGAPSGGFFAETTGDAVYVSRFDNDAIMYYRVRSGFTLKPKGPVQIQAGWNFNGATDVRRYQWANSIETGPGIRLHWKGLPQPVLFSLDALKGRYTVLDGTRPPKYSDFRIGLWYAFSR